MNSTAYLNRYPHMVQEYFAARLRDRISQRTERLSRIKTPRAAQAYVRGIRQAIHKSFAPFPKRTPLNANVTGRDEYSSFCIEKIIFESRPDFLVTANLYLPKGAGPKHPAVLVLCGHAENGKALPRHQKVCQSLVRKGFVVFIIDPIDQGERAQYYPKEGGPALDREGRATPLVCKGHNLTGNQLVLLDDFFGTWRVWDAIRALDYLLSRNEVDRTRVGVTGVSGGGTLSSYLTALDSRLTMAAPCCYICSFLANLESEMPCDSEQNPPGIIGAGLDEADLLMAYAPRPTLILAQYDDYFLERYARKAAGEMKRIYALLGAKNNVAYFAGPHAHGYSRENREAMYAFFCKHAGVRTSATEPRIRLLSQKQLFATPTGETYRAGSRRVFEITSQRAAALAKKRKKPSEEALIRTARRLLRIPNVKGVPEYWPIKYSWRFDALPNQRIQFAVDSEPGIKVILTTFGPEHGLMHPPKGRVTLYVGDISGQLDTVKVGEVRKLAKGPKPLVVADPRGMGQSTAVVGGSKGLFEFYGGDFMYAANADMLAESYLGQRVFDILRVIDLLGSEGATRVDLLGRGMGSIIVTFAALLHRTKPRVKIFHYLPSYQLIAQTPVSLWPFSVLPRGVLKHFDLPDVYRALGRRLTKDKPWSAKMRLLRKGARG